jgi:hypothetical protein
VDSGGLVLRNTTTGQTISASAITFVERSSIGGQWRYDFVHDGALPDGEYTATLRAASIHDKAGNPLPNDLTFRFAFLQGDADGDGAITFDDYVQIDIGFNSGLAGFSNGDFNYDGVVDFDDYVIIDIAFNNQ